ncbi:MAG: TraR/DksA family transcriptional regulator [Pseudomonas sp.]
MDKRSLDRYRKTLKERRDALHIRMISANKQSRGQNRSEAEVRDEGDQANALTADEMTVLQQSQAESLLRETNAALDRIDAGTFGECLNCGQQISARRLEAIPWTRYCITCQDLISKRLA